MLLWAADTSTSTSALDAFLPYLNLGIIAILVLLFVTKTGIIPKWILDERDEQHKREIEELNRSHERELAAKEAHVQLLAADKQVLKADNDRLATTMLRDTIPALTEANRLTAQWIEVQNRRAFREARDDVLP